MLAVLAAAALTFSLPMPVGVLAIGLAAGPLLRVGGPHSRVAPPAAPAVRRTPTVERAP